MKKKPNLYKVTATAYVLASSQEEAIETLVKDGYIPKHNGMTKKVEEVTTVEEDWLNALPYGYEDNEKTCGQIISEA